jgi:hypothetical protein
MSSLKRAQRARGRKQGLKNAAQPGFLSWVATHIPQEVRSRTGRKIKASGLGIFGLSRKQRIANAVKGGKAQGAVARDSGQIQQLALDNIDPKKARKIRSLGGKVSGKNNHKNGVVGKWGWSLHIRWHVNRKKSNKHCPHCLTKKFQTKFAA